jgi:hypothetical protein
MHSGDIYLAQDTNIVLLICFVTTFCTSVDFH